MVTRSPVINVMIRAADKAARSLKRDFGEVENLQVSRKGPADFVSAADLKAEQVIGTTPPDNLSFIPGELVGGQLTEKRRKNDVFEFTNTTRSVPNYRCVRKVVSLIESEK